MDAQAAKRHFTSVSDNEADRRSPNVEASSQGTIVRAVMIGWALASLILTLAMADSIATLRFPDPDDAMRLLEVRDWLAGQSWWDVAQHRFNHGQFPMHWSRLVDIPLAIVLTLAAPLGEAAATRVAMVSVPLVSLLAAMALLAQITRRLKLEDGRECLFLVAEDEQSGRISGCVDLAVHLFDRDRQLFELTIDEMPPIGPYAW